MNNLKKKQQKLGPLNKKLCLCELKRFKVNQFKVQKLNKSKICAEEKYHWSALFILRVCVGANTDDCHSPTTIVDVRDANFR